jgi:hypothetical protein
MLVTFKKGRKHPKDKIVLYNDIPMTFYDWILMGLQFFKNEDNIYPPPAQGGRYLLKALIEICLKGHMDTETLNRYKIPIPNETTTINNSSDLQSL